MTQWQRIESVEKPFSSLSRSRHVNEVPTTTCLRCHYVHAVLTTQLLRYNCLLIRPRPHYAFLTCSKFDHVHEDLTTLLSVSTTLLLRPTSSNCIHPFFKDVVRTWLSVMGGLGISKWTFISIFKQYSRNHKVELYINHPFDETV